MGSLGHRRVTTLTFDCYGTLVDWERGACTALRQLLPPIAARISDDELVRAFLTADSRLIAREVMPYAEVLAKAASEVFGLLGVHLDRRGEQAFVASLPSWPLFEETNSVLERLSRRFRLAIISNIDVGLIAETLKSFTVSFDAVMTSERAHSYKPEKGIFARALQDLGEPSECVVHIAEGLCEAGPAHELGMGSVWVRRSDRSDDGSGAIPDARVDSLTELVQIFCAEGWTS